MRGHVLRLGIILALLSAMVVVRFFRAGSDEVGRRDPVTSSLSEKVQPAPPPRAPSRLLYRGRVVNEQGHPLPGARVAWPAASPDDEAPSLETAADGGFEIALEPSAPAGLDLILVAAGYRPLRRSMGPTTEGARVTYMLTSSPSVEGVVVDQEGWRPLPNADIDIHAGPAVGRLHRIRSDPSGHFTLNTVPDTGAWLCLSGAWAGPLMLRVDAQGRVLNPPADVPASVLGASSRPMLLVGSKSGTLLVDVRTPEGLPAAGCTLYWKHRRWTADAQGTARLRDLPMGEQELFVIAEGHLRSRHPVRVEAARETPVTLTLTRGAARVFGRIRVTEGQPVPDRVEVMGASGWDFNSRVSASVAEDGAYTVDVPENEKLRLRVFFKQRPHESLRVPWMDPAPLRLASGASLERNLDVEPLSRVEVDVSDVQKKPVVGAKVRGQMTEMEGAPLSNTLYAPEGTLTREAARYMNWQNYAGIPEARTGPTGRMVLWSDPGRLSFTVTHPGFVSPAPVALRVDKPVHSLSFTLRGGVRVPGLVLSADGKPAPGYTIRLEDLRTDSGADGRFALEPVLPGQRRLTLSWPGFHPSPQVELLALDVVCEEGMAPVELRLPRLPMIRGFLRGDLGVGRVEFHCAGPRGLDITRALQTRVDVSGQFVLGPVPAGIYGYKVLMYLEKDSDPYVPARGTFDVPAQQDAILDIPLAPPVVVPITLTIGAAAPFDSYLVRLDPVEPGPPVQDVVENAGGTAATRTMNLMAPPGEYRLTVVGERQTEDIDPETKMKVLISKTFVERALSLSGAVSAPIEVRIE